MKQSLSRNSKRGRRGRLSLESFRNRHPSLLPRRLQHRIQHQLSLVGIAKIGLRRSSFGDPFQKVGYLVHKSVFISDLQTGDPPFAHVWMIAVTYMDRTPAADDALIAMIEIVEAMQIMQVPGYRGMLAVDLKGVESLVAAGIAGGFEDRQRAVLESCQKGAGVVDADFFHFARQIVLAFLNKRFRHGV